MRSKSGMERRRADSPYTCEIGVNGRVVCHNSRTTPADVLSPHEGRLNRSSPYPPSRMRFEIDWTGSNNHDTPGCVSVRFQFRGQPSIWRLSASRLSSRNSGFLTGWQCATGGFERYAVKEPESSSRQPRFPVDKPCCFTQLV